MSVPIEDEDVTPVSSATGRPLTKRGEATRSRLLEAAETVSPIRGTTRHPSSRSPSAPVSGSERSICTSTASRRSSKHS